MQHIEHNKTYCLSRSRCLASVIGLKPVQLTNCIDVRRDSALTRIPLT